MAWRLQFADRAVYAVQLLPGDPGLVAIFSMPQTVHFFDKLTGASHGAMQYAPLNASDEPGSPAWREFTAHLRAPGGVVFPNIDAGIGIVHSSHDGHVHLVHLRNGCLMLDIEGRVAPLNHPEDGAAFVAAALDRELGTVAALDDRGSLHFFQQHISMGQYAVSHDSMSEPKRVLLPDAADRVWVIEPGHVQVIDLAGRTLARAATPESSGQAAVSPDAQLLVLVEASLERITVFDGDLLPMRRANMLDLLENAMPVQLLEQAGWVADSDALIATDELGFVAFCWGGWLCVTTLDEFAPLPRPRLLL